MSQWVEEYGHSHQHPVNRVCHTFGIPMIAVSILIGLGALAVQLAGVAPGMTVWTIAGGLFLAGWVLQFIGHFVEGKPPEFFKDWRFLFVGLRWWLAKIR